MGHDTTWVCDWCKSRSKQITYDIFIKGTYDNKLQLGTDEICKECVDEVKSLKNTLSNISSQRHES